MVFVQEVYIYKKEINKIFYNLSTKLKLAR